MKVSERFLKYIAYSTASDDKSGTHPSTARQLALIEALKDELSEMGIQVSTDKLGYLYAEIPASNGYESVAPIGFIAHVDTSPECSGEGVKAKIFENYDGKDLELGNGVWLKQEDFPHLPSLAGRTLITASGDTLLGADDKAGVAEIMTLAENLMNGDIPHGKICIAFTPDEEIGEGADNFDTEKFGATYAYTVDGGMEGGVEYENFNAAGAKVDIKGFSVHPGSSKDAMINAALVAMEFNSMLPATDTPRNTDGYQGFFHLCSMSGGVSNASLEYIIRDHDAAIFAHREKMMEHVAELLNAKYGEGTVTLNIKEQYRNMYEVVLPHKHIIDKAIKATEMAGVPHFVSAIRGGTDGARISFMGIPCPNLGTGGYAFHGPCEHITAEGMEKVVMILENIVTIFAEEK